MNVDDAEALVTRYGLKHARLLLLKRRVKTMEADIARLETELTGMEAYVAEAGSVLDEADRRRYETGST